MHVPQALARPADLLPGLDRLAVLDREERVRVPVLEVTDRDDPVDAADQVLVLGHVGDAALHRIDPVASSGRRTLLGLVVTGADVDADVVVALFRGIARVEERGAERMLLVDGLERPTAVRVVVPVREPGQRRERRCRGRRGRHGHTRGREQHGHTDEECSASHHCTVPARGNASVIRSSPWIGEDLHRDSDRRPRHAHRGARWSEQLAASACALQRRGAVSARRAWAIRKSLFMPPHRLQLYVRTVPSVPAVRTMRPVGSRRRSSAPEPCRSRTGTADLGCRAARAEPSAGRP